MEERVGLTLLEQDPCADLEFAGDATELGALAGHQHAKEGFAARVSGTPLTSGASSSTTPAAAAAARLKAEEDARAGGDTGAKAGGGGGRRRGKKN